MPKKSQKEKHSDKSKPRYKPCVPPWSRFIPSGDTHSLCVVCLGADHAESALEGADCPHCERLPLRALRSRKALFKEGAFTSVPRGSGPASAEAERRLHSWGSQLDLLEGMETDPGPVLRDWKPALRLLPPQGTASTLRISSSVEVESECVEVAPQSPQYEELLEVVTRAVAKLNIDWPAEKQAEPQRSKLDERFLPRLFVPASDYYGNVAGTTECGYRAIPRVEQTLASYLSPEVALSLKAPVSGSVNSVVDRYQEARKQAAAFQRFLPRRVLTLGAAGREQPQPSTSSSYRAPRPDLRIVLQAKKSSTKRSRRLCRTAEGSPCWGGAGCTASQGVRLSSVPSGDHHAHPAGVPGRSGLRRAHTSVSSARQRSRAEELATPAGVSRTVSSVSSCRCAVTGHRASSSHKSKAGLERLVPLVDYLAAWKLLPNVSAWVLCTVERGYRIQFGALPPPFNGVFPTVVNPEQGLVMEQEVETLLRKEAIEVVPPHNRESGFYSRYFIVPKKDGGLRPILDLRQLNRSVMRLKFKMLTINEEVPFGLALSPRTFTKCVDAALAALQLRGIRILNYIDDWLILAHSEHMAVQHRDVVLAHMKELGLRLNAKKKNHLSRRGVGFDHDAGTFVTCSDRVDPHCSHESERRPVTHCKAVPATTGSDGSCVQCDTFWPAVHETPTVVAQDQGVLPEGKPVLHDQGHTAMPTCLRHVEESLVPVSGPSVRSSLSPRNASNGCVSHRLGCGHERPLTWHINCLEMLAVFRALKHFLPDLIGRHVLVRTDNTAVVYYINHQGGLRSRPLYKLAHQILVWSQDKLLSLRAVHVPGHLNMGADILSRQGPRPGEWMVVETEVVETILQSRAPSRKLYALKWKLFTSWCGHRQQDPVNCPVGTVLEYLQDRFSAGLAHSTLRVYVAAISAYHAPLGGLMFPPRCAEAEDSSTASGPYVGALDTYVHRAALCRWIVDAISLAYEFSGLPSPLGVKAHSTRGISASKAFMSGVPMQDICDAAGWSTPLTFVRFYDLDLRVAPGSSGNVSGYDCNPGSPKGTRCCVSCHTSCIPASVRFFLKLNAGSSSVFTLKAFPKSVCRRSVSFPWGTGVTVIT
ncbi:hypothetical protein H4Q32_021306 [Labeo rohita]|uniref:ribonuclease H n=1 Tax=Labeo rohita TaxID=84645 RepID=A0ABQ8M2T6_LABRO|nr:hypothetical protein H4Q32_021306 [Labeo rohita]